MAYRRALMEDIENIVTRVIAEGSENKLREDARWLASLSGASPQLSSQELNKIRQKLARVQSYLKKFDQERRQKNNEHHIEMRKRSDEAVLRDREIFRRILMSLIADTERRSKADIIKLKKAAEEIQKLQLWLAQRIQELEDEYEDNGRRLEELNQRARELEESIARNRQIIESSFEAVSGSDEMTRLYEAYQHSPNRTARSLTREEFVKELKNHYCESNDSIQEVAHNWAVKVGLEPQTVLKIFEESPTIQNAFQTRQDKLQIIQQDQEEHQQNRTEATAVESKMNRIAERLDKLKQEFLVKSANLDASYQVLQELVLDLWDRFGRDGLSKAGLSPQEMEYLEQIDLELAKHDPAWHSPELNQPGEPPKRGLLNKLTQPITNKLGFADRSPSGDRNPVAPGAHPSQPNLSEVNPDGTPRVGMPRVGTPQTTGLSDQPELNQSTPAPQPSPNSPDHSHLRDAIKKVALKTAIAAALLEVPGRIAERQQELKRLETDIGVAKEAINRITRSMSEAMQVGDGALIGDLKDELMRKKREVASSTGQIKKIDKELSILQLPTEELQERLAANESELTKILGIGISCEPVPKVVLAAFLPEGNKPKAKSEAEASLVKSPKPEEPLEDELKPKGFGLGLK